MSKILPPEVLERCKMKINTYLTSRDPLIAIAALEDMRKELFENGVAFDEVEKRLRYQREYVFGREE